jgi:hypothetical protein
MGSGAHPARFPVSARPIRPWRRADVGLRTRERWPPTRDAARPLEDVSGRRLDSSAVSPATND